MVATIGLGCWEIHMMHSFFFTHFFFYITLCWQMIEHHIQSAIFVHKLEKNGTLYFYIRIWLEFISVKP